MIGFLKKQLRFSVFFSSIYAGFFFMLVLLGYEDPEIFNRAILFSFVLGISLFIVGFFISYQGRLLCWISSLVCLFQQLIFSEINSAMYVTSEIISVVILVLLTFSLSRILKKRPQKEKWYYLVIQFIILAGALAFAINFFN